MAPYTPLKKHKALTLDFNLMKVIVVLSIRLTTCSASAKDGVPARGAQQVAIPAAQKRSLQTVYNQPPDNYCEA